MDIFNLEQQTIDIKWKPRVLLIGPGGIKGFKVLGFLSPLEDSGLLKCVDTYCGVSIGSILCLLMISGYEIREIVGEATTMDIFKEISFLNFQTSLNNRGFMSNEPIRKRLSQLIIDKFGNIPTLHSLYMRTGKSFTIVTLNTTDEKCVMMSPFTHPDVSCVDATMFSMNIPFIFYQLIHDGKAYVDGALANPYPIDYFDDGKTNILGISMKTVKSVKKELVNSLIKEIVEDKLTIGSYSLKIINFLMNQKRLDSIRDSSDLCKHIFLETNVGDTILHKVSIEEKANMLVEGFNEGKLFINKLKNDLYKDPETEDKEFYKYPEYYISEKI